MNDDDETIALKIRKAKTDPDPIGPNVESMKDRPEALNLIGIYAALNDQTSDEVSQQYEGSTFAPFKSDLADLIIAKVGPIRDEMNRLLNDPAILDGYMTEGAEHARRLAEGHMEEVYDIMGLLRV